MRAEGERLSGTFVDLRALTASDAEATFRWRNSGRARLLNQGAASVEDQARWIASRPDSEHNWIIALKNGQAVGMLSLVDIDTRNSRAETGRFLIGDEEAVKGVPAAVEAMGLLYRYAFDDLGLHRLYGTIQAENTLMVKWQKYLGMKEEGRLRDHYRTEGGYQDAVFLGILKDEYEKVFIPRAKALMAMGEGASR